MMKDGLHNNVKYSRAISPVATAPTGTTPIVSQILDMANFTQAECIIQLGSLADVDATFAVLVEDGDDSSLSDNAAVADVFLLGLEAGMFLFSSDDDTTKIGYIGPKRYLRVTITPAANSGDVCLAAVWAQSGARNLPQSTQIVAG